MKKKVLFRSLLLMLFVFSLSFASFAINVEVDGQKISFDVEPQLINGRTMVPLRAIFDALNVDVEWNGETQTISATAEGIKLSMVVGTKSAFVNNKEIAMDVPAQIINGRTMVPTRFIAESLGADVEWEANRNTVVINKIKNSDITFITAGESFFYANGNKYTFPVGLEPIMANNNSKYPLLMNLKQVHLVLDVPEDNVHYSKDENTVTIFFKNRIIQLKPGSTNMVINGAVPVATDVETIIISDNILVPIGWIAQGAGINATYDSKTRIMSFTQNESGTLVQVENPVIKIEKTSSFWGFGLGSLELQIDNKEYTKDGEKRSFTVAPYIKNNRTYLPIEEIAVALGARVQLEENDRLIWISLEDRAVGFSSKYDSYYLRVGFGGKAETINLGLYPEFVDGKIMVPSSAVSKALGLKVTQ